MLLPLSASGNAALAGQSMRNAAELALTEFNNPNIQLLVKDDGGSAQGAQQAAQQALDEGAEIILGPLFAQSVTPAAQVARARGVPVIAFSTDSNVAGRGVYLLSFLPESDVDRVIEYAIAQGRRSFVAPGARQRVRLGGRGRVQAGGRPQGRPRRSRSSATPPMAAAGSAMRRGRSPRRRRAPTPSSSRIPAKASLPPPRRSPPAASISSACRRSAPACGTIRASSRTRRPKGGWYPAPDSAGFRAFSTRYRAKYGQEPVRTATLAYDAVALVAALVKTQGAKRFAPETLTNASGFAGIDGVFRFRADGTNQRGLAVLKVTPSGGQVISPAPRSFGGSGT